VSRSRDDIGVIKRRLDKLEQRLAESEIERLELMRAGEVIARYVVILGEGRTVHDAELARVRAAIDKFR
jgi:hypothetical protein